MFWCEDIGRHNALDKVIGFAMRYETDLGECIVISSGRLPTDMVIKAVCARIPVLVSVKKNPTVEAIEMAQKYGLTLICAVNEERMKVFGSV